MKKIIVFFCVLFSVQMQAQTVITNIYGRKNFTLNGKWNYIVDPYETGYYDYRYIPYDQNPNPKGGFFLDEHLSKKRQFIEYDFDKEPTLRVPGDWNSQKEKLFYYEGSVWYRRLFTYKKDKSDDRVFVHFGAANYESDVYLNGKKLGKHIGGFTPFNYEITSLLKNDGKNSLVVKVDNTRKREAIPTVNTDWKNFGGITRDVEVVEVPKVFVNDYFIQLKKGSKDELSGYIKLNGKLVKNQKVKVEIPELKSMAEFTTDDKGIAHVSMRLKEVELWSPESPKLYLVNISGGGDYVTEEIGFRTIETRGHDLLLNGKSIFLRGISIHEENPLRGGRNYSAEDDKMVLDWVKKLDCNYVRLAHYPHNEKMVRLADKMGILVWEENPVYWTILWDNPSTFNNAKTQLTDLITRDKNRACVIIWSMANETPVSDARTSFLKRLVAQARSMDDTRLISAALETHRDNIPNDRVVEDPFAEYVDLISFNEYVGWYDGDAQKCDDINWIIKYNKPVVVSEFGASALQGLHNDSLTLWSEEYQAEVYKHNLSMLKKIPQFRGVTPWILSDFHSPRRLLPGIQDGWNRKGLIGENGTKKKAFYVLRNFYEQIEKEYK